MTRFVCISDTHMRLKDITLPEGDVLLHAGDFTFKGEEWELNPELDILYNKTMNFKKVICIQGNHEYRLRNLVPLVKKMFEDRGFVLLHHEPFEFEGFKFFGSPYSPTFGQWAFGIDRGHPIRAKWAQIPDDTEILLTHGPSHLINDRIPPEYGGRDRDLNVGCADLGFRLQELKKLKLHLAGHIHNGYAIQELVGVKHVNASICNEKYEPVNKHIIVEI